jgi:hypothetical protein
MLPFWLRNWSRRFGVRLGPRPGVVSWSWYRSCRRDREDVPFALVGKKMTWSYFLSPRRKRDSDSLFGVSYVILNPLPVERSSNQSNARNRSTSRVTLLSKSPRNLE